MSVEPLHLTLEVARVDHTGDPTAFVARPQDYTLRWCSGRWEKAHLNWGPELLGLLQTVQETEATPAAMAALGKLVAAWLRQADWSSTEHAIHEALAADRTVVLTLSFAAAELFALPWELVPLRPSGRLLGQLDNLWLRYRYPACPLAPLPGRQPEVLFAWSAAAGAVPSASHRSLLTEAWGPAFRPKTHELQNASLSSLSSLLDRHPAATVLHLLCHGAPLKGGGVGVALHHPDSGGLDVVSPARLGEALAGQGRKLQVLVLMTCQGGHVDTNRIVLSSLALMAHEMGIPGVVASRLPLSIPGAAVLGRSIHCALAAGEALEAGVAEARGRLSTLGYERDSFGCTVLSRGPESGLRVERWTAPPSMLRQSGQLLRRHGRYAALALGPMLALSGSDSALDLTLQAAMERVAWSPLPLAHTLVIDPGPLSTERRETLVRNRAAYGDMLLKLAAVPEGQLPKVVGFDIAFTHEVDAVSQLEANEWNTRRRPAALARLTEVCPDQLPRGQTGAPDSSSIKVTDYLVMAMRCLQSKGVPVVVTRKLELRPKAELLGEDYVLDEWESPYAKVYVEGDRRILDVSISASPEVLTGASDSTVIGAPVALQDDLEVTLYTLSVAMDKVANGTSPEKLALELQGGPLGPSCSSEAVEYVVQPDQLGKEDDGRVVQPDYRAILLPPVQARGHDRDDRRLKLSDPLPLEELLAADIDMLAQDVTSKAIFVGSVHPDDNDEFRARYHAKKRKPGVEFHAAVFEALAHGKSRRVQRSWQDLLVSLGVLGLCALVGRPLIVAVLVLAAQGLLVSSLSTTGAVLPPLLTAAGWAFATRTLVRRRS